MKMHRKVVRKNESVSNTCFSNSLFFSVFLYSFVYLWLLWTNLGQKLKTTLKHILFEMRSVSIMLLYRRWKYPFRGAAAKHTSISWGKSCVLVSAAATTFWIQKTYARQPCQASDNDKFLMMFMLNLDRMSWPPKAANNSHRVLLGVRHGTKGKDARHAIRCMDPNEFSRLFIML